ncbi:hypothetical protein QYS49_27350 [Marivirga salinae]|uniref:Uncharacterized protein n=1 Tax=Marivirga salinarum TaxID=3059078 RepID=A0AA49JGQ0_9BACT|nr:hypothetical protein [Marivirga sp. BDSF4-3]WKK75246.2 hypothetical protein QYS49_27350 [Marivirga sp. BDSF4-3]
MIFFQFMQSTHNFSAKLTAKEDNITTGIGIDDWQEVIKQSLFGKISDNFTTIWKSIPIGK